MPQLDINVDDAYDFYLKYLLDPTNNKAELYTQYGFKFPGIPSSDWELFGAILMRDRKNPSDTGADLLRHEVKSAGMRSSFEYQYHKYHGLDKLRDEANVDHLFFSYGDNYQNLDARLVDTRLLAPIFESWLPLLEKNYTLDGRQRFRKNVPYGFVVKNGLLLLSIREGKLIYAIGKDGS